jgi:ribose 5-phosphate isomerase B
MSMSQTVAIAADYGGFDLKSILMPELRALDLEPLDPGTSSREAVDCADVAEALAAALRDGRVGRGVLICGAGVGVSIAANRHGEIGGALVHDGLTARLARQRNDANVLIPGGRLPGPELASDCLKTFPATAFDGGRHERRVAKMS